MLCRTVQYLHVSQTFQKTDIISGRAAGGGRNQPNRSHCPPTPSYKHSHEEGKDGDMRAVDTVAPVKYMRQSNEIARRPDTKKFKPLMIMGWIE